MKSTVLMIAPAMLSPRGGQLSPPRRRSVMIASLSPPHVTPLPIRDARTP